MRNTIFILLLVVFAACQSTQIKNERYKVASASPELGSIGQSKSLFDLQNKFEVRTLPTLENKIRVAVEVVPFTKRLNKIYAAKAKFNQNQAKINYVDSLPVKPELVTINIQDVIGMVGELDAQYNAATFRLLVDTQKYKMVTAVAVSLSAEEMAKLRQADSYYLINTQDSKYDIALYKSVKKTATITLNPTAVLGYQVSSFCWSVTDRGKWYIADIVQGISACKGKTYSKIKQKKKSKALFDM